jgi:hypothetical protein
MKVNWLAFAASNAKVRLQIVDLANSIIDLIAAWSRKFSNLRIKNPLLDDTLPPFPLLR